MVVGNNESTTMKNVGKLLTILIAMQMRRYDVGHIARWSTSRASLQDNGCHHQVSARIALPRRPPWLTLLNKKTHKTNKTQFLASNYTVHLER